MSNLHHAGALSRHLTTRQMRMLLAIAEHRSVVKASRELNVAQPALSRSLSDLEGVLKLKLFNRSPQGMAPTVFGEALIRRLKAIIGELHDADEELSALRAGTYGHVSIGCIPLLPAGILPRLLSGVVRTRPGLTISVTDGGGIETLLKQLRDRELDMVLCIRPKSNEHDNDFEFEPLFNDTLLLVAGRSHPAARVRKPSLRNIDLDPMVLPSQGSVYRQRIDEAFAKFNRPPPTAAVEANSPMLRLGLAENSDMATFIQASVWSDKGSRYRIKVIPLRESIEYGAIGYMVLRKWQTTPAAAALIEFMRSKVDTVAFHVPSAK
jgi:DNA-binding transcriptional LysR family regulator